MRNLFVKIASGIFGLWLAIMFVNGVEFTGDLKTLLIAGVVLGIINTFIAPLLKLITLPIRILTLGLFGLVINMAMLWLIDIFFVELAIIGLMPLVWTTLIIWGLSLVLSLFFRKK
ncbi:MAG: phage holin family protein [Candidatus Nealsonbacteria bacterium]|nr:phage holin family protein [Candidatus Nealsonbacteria bacterium]